MCIVFTVLTNVFLYSYRPSKIEEPNKSCSSDRLEIIRLFGWPGFLGDCSGDFYFTALISLTTSCSSGERASYNGCIADWKALLS